MNTEWLKLRLYNGSQKDAFEELVCQLADKEPIPNRIEFVRVGAPDGGKEAYCVLSTGEEHAWQAKFFTSMGKSQWEQLNESFETVLKKHSKLTRYYICTPLDREDPRIENKQWFMDKWNSQVAKWQEKARKSGQMIDFIYWGNYELFERLSSPKNTGRRSFWFQETELTDEWFSNRLEQSIRDLGNRYTPEVDFQLPIVRNFHGLARDKQFTVRWTKQFDKLKDVANEAIRQVKDERVSGIIKTFSEQLVQFYHLEETNRPQLLSSIDQSSLSEYLTKIDGTIDQIIHLFYEIDKSDKEKEKEEGKKVEEHSNPFYYEIKNFREVSTYLGNCISYINSSELQAANLPCVLLTGQAGMGKSHLLADIAQKRRIENLPTVLLLGQQFTTTDEPWTQILRLLHLSCDRDTFLAILNTYGETLGSRVFLFIDAINEGQGKLIWGQYIRGFLHEIARYSWIGLVLSVRTSYENLLMPNEIFAQNRLIKINHQGFRAVEYQATKRFFGYYNLMLPNIPLLHPEFSNPLFLHLFCKGLHNKGLSQIPDGYEGITAILTFLLDAVEETLWRKYYYPHSLRLTHRIVNLFAAKFLNSESRNIEFHDAFYWLLELRDLKAIPEQNRGQFIEDLISEGILSKNYTWRRDEITDKNVGVEILYFTYERFGDHLIADYLITNYVDKRNPEESFKQNEKLNTLFIAKNAIYYNQGLLEAMAIQLPEKVGIELNQVLYQFANTGFIASAFIESLLWRKTTAYTKETHNYFQLLAETDEEYWFDTLIQTMLLVTASPGHPYNSDYLHERLINLSMVNRDAWWSKYIHFKYSRNPEEPSAVQRLVDWAWSSAAQEDLKDEAVRLLGQTLAWFLTSSHRILRDSATKALVCLFENRIPILVQILETFKDINDPYVSERLWAVAYGCTLRTKKTATIKELSVYTYRIIFNQDEVYPHILLRDYARQVIEYSVYIGLVKDLDLTKIRPPYKSSIPDHFPTNEEIDSKYKLDYDSPDFRKHHWPQNEILSSMATEYGRGVGGYGDFGRYVFESKFHGWEKEINVNRLSNLAIQWIFEKYGYDVEKLGEFEHYISQFKGDRHSVQSERVGKKYQWIAMHELLARVSDNFIHRDHWGKHEELPYQGPWEPSVRDIDPSILINKTAVEENIINWHTPIQQFDWTLPHADWIELHSDFPDPTKLVQVTNPTTEEEWLFLDFHQQWQEPTLAGEEKYHVPKKNLWYLIKSYIVCEKDYEQFIKWGGKQDFMGNWMPTSWEWRELFSREFYWSPAYKILKAQAQKYESVKEPWRQIDVFFGSRNAGVENLSPVIVPVEKYIWSEQYDASKDEGIGFRIPSDFMFEQMDLQFTQVNGRFADSSGQIVCFDPSVTEPGSSCLLVRKADFIKMLNQNGLRIFWTLLSEKAIYNIHDQRKNYTRTILSGIMYLENERLRFDHIIYDETEKFLKQEAKRKKLDKKHFKFKPFQFEIDEEE